MPPSSSKHVFAEVRGCGRKADMGQNAVSVPGISTNIVKIVGRDSSCAAKVLLDLQSGSDNAWRLSRGLRGDVERRTRGRVRGGRNIVLLLRCCVGRVVRVTSQVDGHRLNVPRLLQRRQHSSEFERAHQTGSNRRLGRPSLAQRGPTDTHVVGHFAHPALAFFLVLIRIHRVPACTLERVEVVH